MNDAPQWQAIPVGPSFLASTLYRPQGSSFVPIVICCHGLTGTRIGSCYRYVHLGRRLADAGMACLTFDFRGCGESGGEFIDMTPQSMIEDLNAVLAWTESLAEFDMKRLGFCASSFGAVTASCVAPEVSGLKGVVFWAPVASPLELIKQHSGNTSNPMAEKLLEGRGWVEHRGLRLGKGFLDQVAEMNADCPAMLAKAGCPMHMFHGKDDTEVPFEHAKAYESALENAGVSVGLTPFNTSDHALKNQAVNEMILSETVARFEEWLLA